MNHDELLRHQAFLRRLSESLVVDPNRADDLVQQTWVAALENPPRSDASPRGWLARVARNFAIKTATGEARRRRREERAARPEGSPSDEDMDERLELQGRVVAAVHGLREPYKAAIFLRYYEGLKPAQIAARQGVPVATVKTRLRRRLELLREELDRTFGDRGAWCLGLVAALHAADASGAAAWLGGNLLGAKALATAAVAAAIAGFVWYRSLDGESTGAEASVVPTVVRPEPSGSEPPLRRPNVAAVAAAEREQVAVPEGVLGADASAAGAPSPQPAGVEPEQEEEPLAVVEGRVFHENGAPAVEAIVVLGPARATTDAGGRFTMPLDAEDLYGRGGFSSLEGIQRESALVAAKPGFAAAVLANFGMRVLDTDEPLEPVELFLGGAALEISGYLVDGGGLPAAGWRVKVLGGTVVTRGPFYPITAEDVAAQTGASSVVAFQETGDDGAFRFGGLKEEREYRIRAWNSSTLEIAESEPLPAGTSGYVLYVSSDPPRPVVNGVVVGLDGTPLENVRCRLTMVEHEHDGGTWMTTGQTVHTGPDGAFVFTDVPHTDLFIRFNGHGTGGRVDLPPEEPGRDLYVPLVREGAFRFEASDPEEAPDTLSVLDEEGERLRMSFEIDGKRRRGRELPVVGGRSPRAEVSELAQWLVCYRDGRETSRVRLRVVPGEVAVVRW